MLRMRGRLKDVKTTEERDKLRRRYATTSGGFACIGSPDEIAEQLALISDIGFTGIGMTSPHYADEVHWYNDEIFPRLEAKGLRSAR